MDYRRSRKTQHAPLCIQGEAVERVWTTSSSWEAIFPLTSLGPLSCCSVVAKHFTYGEKDTTMALLHQEAEVGRTLLSVALQSNIREHSVSLCDSVVR